MVYLFERMFLLHGESKYIDCMERTLYNGVISGMSMDAVDSSILTHCLAMASISSMPMATPPASLGSDVPAAQVTCAASSLLFQVISYGVKDNNIYVNLFAG